MAERCSQYVLVCFAVQFNFIPWFSFCPDQIQPQHVKYDWRNFKTSWLQYNVSSEGRNMGNQTVELLKLQTGHQISDLPEIQQSIRQIIDCSGNNQELWQRLIWQKFKKMSTCVATSDPATIIKFADNSPGGLAPGETSSLCMSAKPVIPKQGYLYPRGYFCSCQGVRGEIVK